MSGRTLTLASALIIALAGCGPDQADYVAENERLLAELPQFPHAKRIGTQHLEIEDTIGDTEFAWRTAGYSTHVVFRVPRRFSGEDVIRFYHRRLTKAGWQGAVSHVDGIPVACYVRGDAFLNIMADGMDKRFPGVWSFGIGVNHDGGAPALC